MLNFKLGNLLADRLGRIDRFWGCRNLIRLRQRAFHIILVLSILSTSLAPEAARAHSFQSTRYVGNRLTEQSRLLDQAISKSEGVNDPPDGAPDYYYATGVTETGYISPLNGGTIEWSSQANALGPQDGLDAHVLNSSNGTHACMVVTFADQPYIESGEIMAYVHQPQAGTQDMGMQLSVSGEIPSCETETGWTIVYPYHEVGGTQSGGPGWYGTANTDVFTGTLQAVRIEIWSNNMLHLQRHFYVDSVRVRSSIPDESALSENEPKNGYGDERECAIATCADSQASGGDPVNTRTGNFDYSLVDLAVQTPAGPLTFQRSYASKATSLYPTTSASGAGWTHNHDIRLISGLGVMRFKAHTANQYKFFDRGSNAFSSAPGVTASLAYSATQQAYVITASDRSTYIFQDSDNGKVTRWRNRRGFGFDYTYDPVTGALTQVTEPVSGRFLRFTYDNPAAPVHIIEVESNLGQVSYGYTNGELTSFIDVMGRTWQYSYDTGSKHRLTQITAPDGQVVLKVNYDSSGRVTKQWNGLPANQSTLIAELTYGANRTTTIKDALARATIHKYNIQGAMISKTDPAGYITTYAYDVNLRPIAITDQDGRQTVLKWSRNGARLVYVRDAAAYTTTLSYDPLGNLTQINAPLGRQTSFTYNDVLLTSSTLHTSQWDITTVYSYTTGGGVPAGLLETITDPLLHQTHFSYDAQGQVVAVQDAASNVTTLSYDAGGRVTDITRGADPVTQTIHIDYNAANQVIRVTLNPNQSIPQNAESQYNLVTEYTYDVRGRLIQVTNTVGDKIIYGYDNADRLTQVSNTNSLNTKTVITSYGYNYAGQLTSVTDPLSHSWTLEYDNVTTDGNPISGRLIKVSDPMSHAFSLAYNPDSTILSVTDPLSYTVTYQYDPLKRVSLVQDNANHWAGYTYDAYGNVLTVTDAKERVTKYEYDERNLLTAVTENYLDQPGSGSDWNVRSTYEYNAAGSLTRITDANLHATRFEYDDLNRLQKKIDPLLHETTFGYDAFGNLAWAHYPNNYTTSYQYDRINRLSSIDYPAGTADVTLAYDPLGRLTGMDDSLGHTSLNWDFLGRLTSLTDPFNKTVGYGYDDAGNLTQLSYPGGPTLTYFYDQADRLTEVKEGAASLAQYGYDNANRLTSVSQANSVTSRYLYDLSGQLSAVTHQTATDKLMSYLYMYDLVGNRIQTIENPFQIHLPLLSAAASI